MPSDKPTIWRDSIKTGYHSLEYTLVGQREGRSAIIMFPSLGCHANFCFEEIIPKPGKDHNLYLFNHPAHGFSNGPLRVAQYQDSIRKVCLELDKRYDHLSSLSHSFGAYMLATSVDGCDLDAQVLTGLPKNLAGTSVTKQLGWIGSLPYPLAWTLFKGYDSARMLFHNRYRVSNGPYRIKGDRWRAHFGAIRMSNETFNDLKDLCHHDEQLSFAADLPTFLIYGDEDKRLGYSADQLSEIESLLDDSQDRFITVSGADHNLNKTRRSGKMGFEQNTDIIENICNFFSESLREEETLELVPPTETR